MCQPTVFADNEPDARGVAVLMGTRLLWTRQQAGIVRMKPLDGSANATTHFDPFDYPTDIATDATGAMFYTSREDGSVNRQNAGGGAWSITPYTTPTGISVDGTTVYVAIQNNDAVESLSTAGNTFQTRASGLNYPADVSVVGGKIYVASGSGILLAARNPPHQVISPTSRFLDGGAGDLIHTGLVVDGTFIYFTVGEKGIVAKVAVDGATPAVILATGQEDPLGIAATPDAIYWANRAAGKIMKLAK
jgi:hypothetical protein